MYVYVYVYIYIYIYMYSCRRLLGAAAGKTRQPDVREGYGGIARRACGTTM